ncbi:putative Xylulose kinase [Burkholderia sp. IT-111MI5]
MAGHHGSKHQIPGARRLVGPAPGAGRPLRVEGAGRIGDRLCDGRLRPADPRLHAARDHGGAAPDARAGRRAGHVDADRRGRGRHRVRRAERPLRARARADLDDPAVRGLYRPVRVRARLLGSARLPHHRGHRAGRRVRDRHGARGRSMAGEQACPRVVLRRARLAGRRAAGRAADAVPAAPHRLARHVRGRRAARAARVGHAQQAARAGSVRAARGAAEGQRVPHACRRRPHRAHERRHRDPVFGPEFRLLRDHDLAADLPVEADGLLADEIGAVDGGNRHRDDDRRLGVRATGRPDRAQADVPAVPARRGRDGHRVCAAVGPDGDAVGRRADGDVRQRDGRRLRGADVRRLSDGRARDRAERAVEYRPRGRRLRAGRGRRTGRALLVPDGHRVARRPLCARHGRDAVPDPRAQGRRARMSAAGVGPLAVGTRCDRTHRNDITGNHDATKE